MLPARDQPQESCGGTATNRDSVRRLCCESDHTDAYLKTISEILLPEGRLGIIDDPVGLETMVLKPKCISIYWEFMFTRSHFQTPDMVAQHKILDRVSELVDDGAVQSTLAENFGTITAANLRRIHAAVEGGRARGKIVLEDFNRLRGTVGLRSSV